MAELQAAIETVQTHANILWTLLAACLVFWMQAGFAFVESGFTRAKSAAHIMMKNLLDMSLGAIIYPVFGHWAWGTLLLSDQSGAWLANMGFLDFAGSTVVHSVGAWAALAGAIVVGPRIGKFDSNGRARPIPGHNMTMASLGVFILFLGWFGFNAGSTTTADGSIARIAVNTFLAACAGSVSAMFVSWFKFGKPDIGMTLNGVLAGLVGITAPCDIVTPLGALIVGAVAGCLVVFSVLFFDKIKIDDPVGAISVHGVCGVWGTLACALLNEALFYGHADYDMMGQLVIQVTGIVVCFVWTFGTAFILFKVVKATVGIRVSEEEERAGLDFSEHGASAYPDFVVSGGTYTGSSGN